MRRLDALASDGVERAEPDGPPTAFRIWRAGLNPTDAGPTLFTDRSAALLLAQQADRGNRYPIDIDHLSLNVDAPLESRRAVGWFSIEVRNGELWARDVEWTDTVRDGLTKEPPEWRYHSPAYDQDPVTGEVLGLLNLAITNLPATHSVTALASRVTKGASMNYEDVKAALSGADEEKRAAAWAAIKSAFDGEEPEKKDAEDEPSAPAKADAEEPPPESEPAPEKKTDAEDDDEPDAPPPEKKDTSVVASIDAELRKVNAKLAVLEKERDDKERATILASREMSAALAKVLEKKPLATVREICAALPLKAEKPTPKTTETIQATRGATHGQGGASRLPADEKRKLDERMGLVKRQASIRHEGMHSYFPVLTAEDARRIRLSKKEGA
ncbi:MAG: hypothetical protein KF795_00245 [Labilithrix sp.]|nr:hypothetical protein [Labilithrix sp.]